jgi:tRNA-intron lyase
MAITLTFDRKKKRIFADSPQDTTSLLSGHYGTNSRGTVLLQIEEALYLMDIRNAKCADLSGNPVMFNELASAFIRQKKLLSRYLTFKDWRDRGLISRPSKEASGKYGRDSVKKYAGGRFEMDSFACTGVFFAEDLITILDDEAAGKALYDVHWLGQFGTYKAAHRGKISKLDVYETLFLMGRGVLKLSNSDADKVRRQARKRMKYFDDMYSVYDDWRSKGYVVKTGFKFGTHFRIYFPGASPTLETGEWMHSRHVIHVFPRKSKLLISEWARAIRVAHSVKKTFILAIPGKTELAKISRTKPRLDFLLYHRKGAGIETPRDGVPRFLMYSLSEDECIGGEELAEALEEARYYGLEALLAISDRESSITYYAVKRILLPGSAYDHFEIEWLQP